jgi:RimJ/RimL family protein N-acetyltransferase
MPEREEARSIYHLDASWCSGPERYRYTANSDLQPIGAMLSDPEVGRWLWFTPMRPEDAISYFQPLVDEQRTQLGGGNLPDALCFTVDDARSGAFLGQGAIVAVPGSDRGFEIGFQLSKKAWGRGVGTRLSRFLCGFAIAELDAYRVEGACLEGNRASAALLQNLGLQHEGTLVDFRVRDGVRHTELRFGARVLDLDLGTIAAPTAAPALGSR